MTSVLTISCSGTPRAEEDTAVPPCSKYSYTCSVNVTPFLRSHCVAGVAEMCSAFAMRAECIAASASRADDAERARLSDARVPRGYRSGWLRYPRAQAAVAPPADPRRDSEGGLRTHGANRAATRARRFLPAAHNA